MDELFTDKIDSLELLQILLRFFNRAETLAFGKYKFHKEGVGQIEVTLDQNNHVNQIVLSNNFSQTSLKKLQNEITKSLIKNQTEKIGRTIAFSKEPVRSYFRNGNVFQILPVPENATKPPFSYADHPFILEFSYKYSSDTMINSQRRTNTSLYITRILNLISKTPISLGPRYAEHLWVFDHSESGKVTSKFSQAGYALDGFSVIQDSFSNVSANSRITLEETVKYYSSRGITGNPLTLPKSVNNILKKAFGLLSNSKDKFARSIAWLSLANDLWNKSHSAYFIALVCSIESLVSNVQKCPKCQLEKVTPIGGFCSQCKQPRYQVTTTFKKFVEKYLGASPVDPNFLGLIYDTRSKLAHGIRMFEADIESFVMFNYNTDFDREQQYKLSEIAKRVVLNWLLSQ